MNLEKSSYHIELQKQKSNVASLTRLKLRDEDYNLLPSIHKRSPVDFNKKCGFSNENPNSHCQYPLPYSNSCDPQNTQKQRTCSSIVIEEKTNSTECNKMYVLY